MKHRAELEMERNLAALRAAPRPMELADGVPVTGQVYFNYDVGQGEVRARLMPETEGLATFEALVLGHPRWMSFSVVLGETKFEVGETAGLVLSARAEVPFSTTPFLRTGGPIDERNSEMGAPIEIGTTPGVAVRLLTLTRREAEAPGNTAVLILPLPEESFRFTLIDMRFFVLPAGAGAPGDLPALGSVAV